jgi:uncharacterized membrane protein YidH (DUF202 family)
MLVALVIATLIFFLVGIVAISQYDEDESNILIGIGLITLSAGLMLSAVTLWNTKDIRTYTPIIPRTIIITRDNVTDTIYIYDSEHDIVRNKIE